MDFGKTVISLPFTPNPFLSLLLFSSFSKAIFGANIQKSNYLKSGFPTL